MARAGFDWAAIDLVVFDVDGTLYRQRSLRLRMALALAWRAVGSRGRETIRILRAYRRLRESVSATERATPEDALIAATARAAHVGEERVREIVAEWIHIRPLPHLRRRRYDGLPGLFGAIRASGRRIGVLSDYPADAKLAALDLTADHVHGPDSAGFTRLKPSPEGLLALIAEAGASPARTVLIGDRIERDGAAAKRAGAHCLIRSAKPTAGWRSFRRYDDPVFAPLLGAK
jgi:FMN phosphatase YigB (HAD superfamily)